MIIGNFPAKKYISLFLGKQIKLNAKLENRERSIRMKELYSEHTQYNILKENSRFMCFSFHSAL